MEERVAIVYQAEKPPVVNRIVKPMKPGGYADSGADIAYCLRQQGSHLITPVPDPDMNVDLAWVFPDTRDGIQKALHHGANIIWLNTILYRGHPVQDFLKKGISVVGQDPVLVDQYDDKIVTNELLSRHGLPVPKSVLITKSNVQNYHLPFQFPVVAKPIRGRGSQGVTLVLNAADLNALLFSMLEEGAFGDAVYVEEYLEGEEVTITVMTPGTYTFRDSVIRKTDYWSMPPVRRFNHQNGIAPYNGTVAVVNNSEVIGDDRLQDNAIQHALRACEKAAMLVGARAPIRIDCRADARGQYYLFDLNMKPNMTGPSRPHRQDQDSLTALAARKIGWQFADLTLHMLKQHWRQ